MMRIPSLLIMTIIGTAFYTGCGKDAAPDRVAEKAASTPQSVAGQAPNTEAVTKAASDFLDAVLKGDTERAKARLTPKSVERITASGKQFQPPGDENATFRIGQVRMPSPDQALVQCVLTDAAADGAPHNEGMFCLMKWVENDWRVCGIAYGTAANRPWTLTNFETGQSMPISRQMGQAGAGQQTAAAGATRPSPPRTAQEPASSAVR